MASPGSVRQLASTTAGRVRDVSQGTPWPYPRALRPYPESLHNVTKVGSNRDSQGGWPPARDTGSLRRSVHDNLDNLGLEVLDMVNLRLGNAQGPQPGSLAEPFETLVNLQQQGLIRHLGVSNVTAEQVGEARAIAPIVCVQNMCTTSPTAMTTT
jgi:pyridoxine 4-dehydrogenase